ncbi:DUF6920 family protein [Limnofasciculus baicalensis]|uniref:Uncharacterized protein n=1 Tax=Limnofasciculus baicalensis BBK-W-15 TaxID=2699891 RepID=A0AAE3KQI4_9CYAN|nr:DUF6544 family protein [Limnofasciculus baicalensis]MCP2727397.1 hypothetical protein [Limnofasciculus baicalensis BBK-W-15]
MTKSISLNTLWESATPTELVFNSDKLSHLPEAAKRYLEHTIAPGTKLASAVRLKMHGEIKLKKWIPFKAEQVICWEHGFIWSATAWMNGLPIVGSDRVIDGVGAMQWKLLGLFPVMTASGADITRSAIGRLQSESVCLPSVFCGDDVLWTSTESADLDSNLHSSFVVQGEKAELDFTIESAKPRLRQRTGCLKTFKLPRWGNPDGAEFRYVDFGGTLEEDRTFCGYTIPTRLRIGWYFGTERFESEGEFFRATIDDAIYR